MGRGFHAVMHCGDNSVLLIHQINGQHKG
jgi:hypothetical protein